MHLLSLLISHLFIFFFSETSLSVAVISSIKASLHSSTQFLTTAKTSIVSILPLLFKSKKAIGSGRTIFIVGMSKLIDVGIDVGVSVVVGTAVSSSSDGVGVKVGVEMGVEVGMIVGVGVGVDVGVGVGVIVGVAVGIGVGVGIGAMQAEVSKSQAMSQLKLPLA